MVTLLKATQLAISVVVALFMLFYPGIMVVLTSAVGMTYAAASIGAILDNRIAIWVAFVFSTITAVLSVYGVSRFLRNGFDFLAGNFGQLSGFYYPPYLLLAISLGAAFVVIAHLTSWRWMVSGQLKDTP